MKLWVLDNTSYNDYDTNGGFVIRAQSEQAARKLAASVAADEGETTWRAKQKSTCIQLKVMGEEEIVLCSFHAG